MRDGRYDYGSNRDLIERRDGRNGNARDRSQIWWGRLRAEASLVHSFSVFQS